MINDTTTKNATKNVNNWMFSEVDSDLKVVQGMAEQVKDVKVSIP